MTLSAGKASVRVVRLPGGAWARLGVVVRHGGEEVVRDVRVGDVVEDVVQRAVGAVHRAQRPPQPRPLVVGEVRQRRVRVLRGGTCAPSRLEQPFCCCVGARRRCPCGHRVIWRSGALPAKV